MNDGGFGKREKERENILIFCLITRQCLKMTRVGCVKRKKKETPTSYKAFIQCAIYTTFRYIFMYVILYLSCFLLVLGLSSKSFLGPHKSCLHLHNYMIRFGHFFFSNYYSFLKLLKRYLLF